MRRKKNKPFRKQILKETETDKISGTDITEKLYQRHPDLEQLWYFCNLQHSAPCWIQRRPQHTGSHQKLKVMSTFMYIILPIYPLFAHLFLPFKEVYHSPLHLLHIIFWDFMWHIFCFYTSQALDSFRNYACVLSCFSCVQFFVTSWTVAHQATLSMGVSRQEYWSG